MLGPRTKLFNQNFADLLTSSLAERGSGNSGSSDNLSQVQVRARASLRLARRISDRLSVTIWRARRPRRVEFAWQRGGASGGTGALRAELFELGSAISA